MFCNIKRHGECWKHIAEPNPNGSLKDHVMASQEDTPTGSNWQHLPDIIKRILEKQGGTK
jgi:hypothetical protein